MSERAMWTVAWLLEGASAVLLALGITQHNFWLDFGSGAAALEGIGFAFGASV